MTTNGKGSTQRGDRAARDKYAKGWDAIFGHMTTDRGRHRNRKRKRRRRYFKKARKPEIRPDSA